MRAAAPVWADGDLTMDPGAAPRKRFQRIFAPRLSEGLSESRMEDANDETLVMQTRQGDPAAFEALIRQHQHMIYSLTYRMTGSAADAEDLTQETFCKAWRGLHRYNPSLSFAPWLFAIARHTAASHFRSAEPFDELPSEAGIVEENPASLLASKDDADALWQLARTLKPRHWEVLWFRYGEGFSVAETARAMGTNEIHVKVMLHRARAGLARRLAARGGGPAAAKFQAPDTNTIPAPEP